jgi:hypothetical protein
MTQEQISALTLGELEAISQRLEAAARVFRDARSLLGGAAASQPTTTSPVVAAVSPAILTPHELAQREALLARNRYDALPDEVKRAERTPPP